MGAPDYEKRLHANRRLTTPWVSKGKGKFFSRTNHLTYKVPTSFGDDQSLNVTSEDPTDKPADWPQDWPKAGRFLTVPKTVILSSFPYWACYQPGFNFYAPKDVVGTDGTYWNNYYYFDQWDRLGTAAAGPDAYSKAHGLAPGDADQEGDGDRRVGHCDNPYYAAHATITKAFKGAKAALEKAGIGVIIPEWMPVDIIQQRNNYLVRNFSIQTHLRPCITDGTVPISLPYTVNWGPPYPDPDDTRNAGLNSDLPWLTSMDPGFGTDVLHLYVGHPNLKIPGSPDGLFGYQAWPLAPEAVWIGPLLETAYLGGDMYQPAFNGRRPIWRNYGYDYGFTGPAGVEGVYDFYGSSISGPADAYKKNALKYRNFTTKLFTYRSDWNFGWDLGGIWRDRYIMFDTANFYAYVSAGIYKTPWDDVFGMWNSSEVGGGLYGYNFTGDPTDPQQALAAEHDVDIYPTQDCPGTYVLMRLGNYEVFNIPKHEIESAIANLFPPIMKRIEAYYRGIEPGTKAIYDMTVERNGLEDYGVTSEGAFPGDLMSAGGIIDYVRNYFKT